jgi:hypothetical protein
VEHGQVHVLLEPVVEVVGELAQQHRLGYEQDGRQRQGAESGEVGAAPAHGSVGAPKRAIASAPVIASSPAG